MRTSLSAIMAEQFPRFELGFEFLNTDRDDSVKESYSEAPVEKEKRFAELTEEERNRLLVETQAKATKSTTNWAVNAFKGKETHNKYKLK